MLNKAQQLNLKLPTLQAASPSLASYDEFLSCDTGDNGRAARAMEVTLNILKSTLVYQFLYTEDSFKCAGAQRHHGALRPESTELLPPQGPRLPRASHHKIPCREPGTDEEDGRGVGLEGGEEGDEEHQLACPE